ncbi:MAG: AzlC family ABC transporter permease [Sulfobacillus sp.]|nr:AzlC family ABC transporter permease [Sulfobacillus sp.]
MKSLIAGMRAVWPIVLAYAPVSAVFGALAVHMHEPLLIAVLISALVYAGSAQFMLLSMALAHNPIWTTIGTVLLVNMRHLFYGMTLKDRLTQWTPGEKALFAFGLTDEVYLWGMVSARTTTFAYWIGASWACYLGWVGATAAGAWEGKGLPASWTGPLQLTLPLLFLGLLLTTGRSRAQLWAAFGGGAWAALASLSHAAPLAIFVGAIGGATLGWGTDRLAVRKERPEQGHV